MYNNNTDTVDGFTGTNCVSRPVKHTQSYLTYCLSAKTEKLIDNPYSLLMALMSSNMYILQFLLCTVYMYHYQRKAIAKQLRILSPARLTLSLHLHTTIADSMYQWETANVTIIAIVIAAGLVDYASEPVLEVRMVCSQQ